VLLHYKRKANIAAIVWLAAMLSIIPIALSMPPGASIWDGEHNLGLLAGLTMTAAYLYGLWAYLKAKGQPLAWIVLAVVLNLIGLIIVVALPDKHKSAETNQQ
jgi:hypothetical protein